MLSCICKVIKLKHKIFIPFQILIIVVLVFGANISANKNYASVSNDASNRVINLTTMALKLEEDIKNDLYSAKDTFTGDITGYGADCPLCGGTLACKPSYYVRDGTTTYFDNDLPCGSIVRFQLNHISQDPIIAIVLDRGVLGNDLDLLMPSEAYANQYAGRTMSTYDVLRTGWTR